MAQHTKGPWAASGLNVYASGADGPKRLVGAAQATGLAGRSAKATPEDLANARLMASAPDMLVTAQLTLAALDVAIDNCTWKLGLHLVAAEQAAAQLRAAIAKARGV
jgi:hypothetical protein